MLMNIIKFTLLIPLISCRSVEVLNVNQYSINGKTCLKRHYQFSENYIGKISPPVYVDINECANIVGFESTDYVKVINWIQSINE